MNPVNVLGAASPMTTAVALALVTLILWLAAVLDAVAFLSTVEALVASWGRWLASSAFSFLLLIVP